MTPPPAVSTLRLFLALWPDAGTRAALAALARACAVQTEGRAAVPANLHLTLAFLGNVAANRLATLRAIGLTASAAEPPFTLTLDRIGAFARQEIVWLGPSLPNIAVERLARVLGDGLTAAGFELERRAFHPHVTLVRRNRARMPDSVRDSGRLPTPIVWNVTGMTLVVSEPARGALRYVVLDNWPLGMDGSEA